MPHTSRGLALDLVEDAAPPDDDYEHWFQVLGQWSRAQFDEVFKMRLDEADSYDSGPFNTWLHTHRRLIARYSVFLPEHCRLRRCGYVFWDVPEKGPKREAFRKGLKEARRRGCVDRQEPEGVREEMERSWTERAEVFSNGGRGYWTRGDLSKIVWEDGRKPSESAEVMSS